MSQVYELRNIEFAYSEEAVLHIDEYCIEENTINALVGDNGSGKSTLLNLLAFISKPKHGQISFYGEAVVNGQTLALRRKTAYVQQKPYLFNFTVVQNIELGLKLRGMRKTYRREKAEGVAASLGIQDLLSKRAHELSGGEIQKVAIARAMILEPKVLLLDEPFSHLDKQSSQDIEYLLVRLANNEKRTIIFSTHDHIQAHALADNVCNLERGRFTQNLQINRFKGEVDITQGVFDTGKLKIQIPSGINSGTQLTIDSAHLVLSNEELKSSMRNHFQGRVSSLQEAGGEIHITVEAGETWYVIITAAALSELKINIGDSIWLSFKSTAVQVF
jgi:molybdopterin-binding protein